MKKNIFIIGSIIAFTLILAAPVAQAATNAPSVSATKNRVVMGRITAIDGTSLTIAFTGKVPGTSTIEASSAKVVIAGVKSLVADLRVGDNILVSGSGSLANITAKSIHILPTATTSKHHGLFSRGMISNIDGSTISITEKMIDRKTKSQTTTVETFTVNSNTKVSAQGKKSVTISDLKVGDSVMIASRSDVRGAMTALMIQKINSGNVIKIKHVTKTH